MCRFTAAMAYCFLEAYTSKGVRIPKQDVDHKVIWLLGENYADQDWILLHKGVSGYAVRVNLDPPDSLKLNMDDSDRQTWSLLKSKSASLAFLILALSTVKDLTKRKDMNLPSFKNQPSYHWNKYLKSARPEDVSQCLSKLDLTVQKNCFFTRIPRLLIGPAFNDAEPYTVASGWGWTMLNDCYSDCSPAESEPCRLQIERGVPYKSYRYAHYIKDGSGSQEAHGLLSDAGDMNILPPRCTIAATVARYDVTDDDYIFLVNRNYGFYLDSRPRSFSVGMHSFFQARLVSLLIESCTAECQNAMKLNLKEPSLEDSRYNKECNGTEPPT